MLSRLPQRKIETFNGTPNHMGLTASATTVSCYCLFERILLLAFVMHHLVGCIVSLPNEAPSGFQLSICCSPSVVLISPLNLRHLPLAPLSCFPRMSTECLYNVHGTVDSMYLPKKYISFLQGSLYSCCQLYLPLWSGERLPRNLDSSFLPSLHSVPYQIFLLSFEICSESSYLESISSY